jgi:putative ABC transport system substrate-binding protein
MLPLGLEVVTSTADIESTMAKFGDAGAGLVVMPDTFLFTNRKKIISLAERYHLQTIYPFPSFLAEGGLISYGARRSRVRRPTPIAS